jgi:anaerobic selenocysteine-containing dehydrogenase
MDLDTLAGEYLRIPGHDIPWADKRFATPSQKIEIFSRAAESAGQSPLPCFINPSKGEDRFPLRLLTCKTKRSMHSQAFVFEDRKPAVSVNRKTAQNFGIFGLERVCIATRQGEVTARLILDEAVCDGTAFMHQGWWHKSGAVNFLTHAGLSDMGEQAAFYDTFCTLSSI